MFFAVRFADNPDAPADLRTRHMPAHLAFLEDHSREIHAAGPLRDAAGTPAGGLSIVEAASAEDVERLVHDNPFWPTGLRASVSILA